MTPDEFAAHFNLKPKKKGGSGMKWQEEKERLWKLIEEKDRRIQNLIMDNRWLMSQVNWTWDNRNEEIDRLRSMLGMAPLYKQKPARVLRLVKRRER